MRRRTIFLALWIVASAATAGGVTADALWLKGDYRGAFAQAFQAAQHGDSHAQYLLGESYRLGRSVDPDASLAEEWYARAARQGDVLAATELGLLQAGRRRADQALPWLTYAASHGEPRALCSLAALYFNGDGVARDPVRAYALMMRAAATGLPEAIERLGLLRTLLPADVRAAGEALAADGGLRARPTTVLAARRAQPSVAPTLMIVAPLVRVQVGAFRSAAAAENAWAYLVGRVDGIGRNDHAVIPAGAFYRLQAQLADGDAASAFCRQLKAAHWQHFAREAHPPSRVAGRDPGARRRPVMAALAFNPASSPR